MSSPRSGFRRAALASWALAGIGVAGVAGASALAYGDTLKPVADATPQTVDPIVDSVQVTEPVLTPAPLPQAPPAEPTQQTSVPAPGAVAAQQPASQQTYIPEQPAAPKYTQTYAPQPAYTAPAPTYSPPPQPAYSAPAPAQSSSGVLGGSSPSVMGGSSSGNSGSGNSGGGNGFSNTSTRQSRMPMGGGSGPNKAVPHTTARGS